MHHHLRDGIMGMCVADAIGVPVEFNSRESLRTEPVTDIRGYGTYQVPPGTWSDDTSMTLALLDSLTTGLDYKDIMDKFLSLLQEAHYTPYEDVFDIGYATRKAIMKYAQGEQPLNCGGQSEYDNGNGSLMRILPLAYYLRAHYGDSFTENEEAMTIIHFVSALTHAHPRSQIACGLYCSIASLLIQDCGLSSAISAGIERAKTYYEQLEGYQEELQHYKRLWDMESFRRLPEEEIQSSGYVVDSLEAAIWCLLNTEDYKSCVLKAVNLGEDTDTIASIAGGLAGLSYGVEQIPPHWLDAIPKRDYIEQLCDNLADKLSDKLLQLQVN